jgi:O-antigen ligase
MVSSTTTPATAPDPGSRVSTTIERIRLGVLGFALLLLPVIFDGPAYEAFRLPRELLMEACGVLLGALSIIEALLRGHSIAPRAWPQSLRIVLVGALGWSMITAIISANIALSVSALLFAFAAAMIFVTTYNTAHRWSPAALLICSIPAVVNAIVAILQRTDVLPIFAFHHRLPARFHAIALLGNPNDVGAYLLLPLMATIAIATTRDRFRIAAAAMAAVIAAGIVASETLTTIGSIVIAVIALTFLMRRRVGIILVGILIIGGIAGATLLPGRWASLQGNLSAAEGGDLDPLLSNRTEAFIAAWRIFLAHPLTGVGIGGYKYAYFDAKVALEDEHPEFLNKHSENFGEAHNEHLQLLAEGGLPMYAFFIGGLWLVGRRSFSRGGSTRREIARRTALPSAVAIAVSTLASFPMRLAAPTVTMLAILAITLSWTDDESA